MFTIKLNQALSKQLSFISDPLNYPGFIISAVINIIHWAIDLNKIGSLRGQIILHYNTVYGADLVGKTRYAYLIPAVALAFFLANLLLASFFYKREKLAGYFLNFATIAIQLIFLAASLAVININE